MLDLVRRLPIIWERFQGLQLERPGLAFFVLAALTAFGILNCLFGYRLLRFWMMLAGFGLGAGGAYFILRSLETPLEPSRLYILVMLVSALVLALIVFFFYRAGIFMVVSAMGAAVSVYIVRPNSSATFFLCLLIGVVLGIVAIRFEKELVIFLTGLFGGAVAGYCLARMLNINEYPEGVMLWAGFALTGWIVQVVMNRSGKTGKEEMQEGKDEGKRPGKRWDPVDEDQENEEERRRRANEFYEQYFNGEDVFDRVPPEEKPKKKPRFLKSSGSKASPDLVPDLTQDYCRDEDRDHIGQRKADRKAKGFWGDRQKKSQKRIP